MTIRKIFKDEMLTCILSLPILIESPFLYDFTTDAGFSIDPVLYATIDGDAGCAVFDFDASAPTNFFEVTHFSFEDCRIRGSYDLTFRLREGSQNNCNDPSLGDVVRFSEGSFNTEIADCE